MAVLEVLAGGVQTTMQDLGRVGHRAVGVPLGGAMDRFALQAANRLLGNPVSAACLEVLLGGLRLRCLAPCVICIAGADLQAEIDGARLHLWTPVELRPANILTFSMRRSGARAYLALAGGIEAPLVLGSRSTYLPAGWGGHYGRALNSGDQLTPTTDAPCVPPTWLPPEHRPPYTTFPTLRCVLGPHHRQFAAGAIAAFFGDDYTLTAASDRMGYRLAGPVLVGDGAASLPSLGVLPGCIQVPPHGQPILLMADAQTTGGYPIIATVIAADLPLAAQLLPGDKLRFRPVSLQTAVAAARNQQQALDQIGAHAPVDEAPI